MRMTTPKEVCMRGDDQEQQDAMWSYVPMERRIPADHPLRRLRPMVDGLLQELSPRFDELYSRVGRPSIAPEKLLRALLLQVLYTIRSERLLMEQLDYNLLFRWFVGLEMDDPIWNPTVFTKNRERLLAGEIATLGRDKGYDTRDFVAAARLLGVTPHVAQNTTNRASALDGRTTRHAGYAVSQPRRKRVEEIFGWLKTVGLMRKTRHRGTRRVDWMFTFALAAYNLVRIRNLTAQTV